MDITPKWAKAMSDDASFLREQACLGVVWTFLGFEDDIPNVNDWFRTTLGGRSIFVQRFNEGLSAFENICPHRFNQIRSKDNGNGHVVCGFHHWRFDSNGYAIGIPKCKQVFGKTAQEMNACLRQVQLALCGGLVFGRFGEGPSLEEWLGDGYDILKYLTANLQKTGSVELTVDSHWKPMMAVTLDDYHIVAIHPSTIGKRGFLPVDKVRYYRFGEHSAFIPSDSRLEKISAECREGRFSPKGYAIFQFFPTFVFVITRATRILGDDYWYVTTEQMIPQACDRTLLHKCFFSIPFTRPAGFIRRMVRRFVQPVVNLVFGYYARKILQEDTAVCENAQRVAYQIGGNMLLSNQEQRIEWFEDAYAKYVSSQSGE